MAEYSSILAWKNPRMEELCRLQSVGLQRVKTPLSTQYNMLHSKYRIVIGIGLG